MAARKRKKATEADPLGFRKHRARAAWARWHRGDTVKALGHDYGMARSSVYRMLHYAAEQMYLTVPPGSRRVLSRVHSGAVVHATFCGRRTQPRKRRRA